MISFLKNMLLGAFIGVFYGFVSYYLLSPNSMFSLSFIVSFSLQGALFVVAFTSLGWIFQKFENAKETKIILVFNIVKGAISGFFSGSINMFITYSAQVTHYQGELPTNLKQMVINDLTKYAVGCILLGVFIGCLITYLRAKRV